MVFLLACYILKIFLPNEFLLIVSNKNIIKIGNFIDNHKYLKYVLDGLTSFITYYLYLCATCRVLKLSWKRVITVVLCIAITFAVNEFDVTLAMHLNIASMLILPLLFKGNLFTVAIVYSAHGLAQCLSLSIRNYPIYLMVNSATSTIMILECYFWLLLFYIIFNFKKEKKDGSKMSSVLREVEVLREEEGKSREENRKVPEDCGNLPIESYDL